MNIQHLRHFVAVAEELHFGRASERLGMAQPPLSQSIQRLETSLGCSLFVRARRRIELTAAGETLLEYAREITALVETARKRVIEANEIGLSTLTIGFTPSALSGHVTAAMRVAQSVSAEIVTKLIEGTSKALIGFLDTGQVDVAIMPEPADTRRGLVVRLIERNAQLVAVPEAHPLVAREQVCISELDGEPMILVPEEVRPAYRASINASFRDAGARLNIVQEAAFDHSRLKMVAEGLGLTLVSPRAAPRGYPGVVLKPIEDLPASTSIGLCMVWRNNLPAPLRRLLDTIYLGIKD